MKCQSALLLVLWVLWTETRQRGANPSEFWHYIDAHETRSSCEAQVKEALSIAKRNAKKVLDSGKILGTTNLSYIDQVDEKIFVFQMRSRHR